MNLLPAIERPETPVAEVADLIYATGPSSYGYQFDGRKLFDALVHRSWILPGSLFAADATTLAVEGDELAGIEIGFHGPEFNERKEPLGSLWADIIEKGEATPEDLRGLGRRVRLAAWLNPVIPNDVYYIHAISVKASFRGRKVGLALMQAAIERARASGFRAVQLDVLSDNPAVQFYRSLGYECLVESRGPIPAEHGVPMEMRMELRL